MSLTMLNSWSLFMDINAVISAKEKKGIPVHKTPTTEGSRESQVHAALPQHAERLFLCFEPMMSRLQWSYLTKLPWAGLYNKHWIWYLCHNSVHYSGRIFKQTGTVRVTWSFKTYVSGFLVIPGTHTSDVVFPSFFCKPSWNHLHKKKGISTW